MKMIPRRHLLCSLALASGLAPWNNAWNRTGHDVDERAEALANELPALRDLAEIPGFSVALATRAGVAWSGAFGVRDQRTGAPVDGDTVFEAASLSKPVFGYAVLRLAEADVIDLDAPLAGYAPYADLTHDARHAGLTARMVLTHTTGLPNWRPNEQPLDFEYEPGERWRYSGEGFVLLQRTIEALTGDSLEELAHDLVFEPFGMTRSSYVWRDRFEGNVALPHDELGLARSNRHIEEGNAAYSLLTTAGDYARFLAGLLRGDNLERDTLADMLRSQADVNTGVTWGLGWGLEANDDGPAFWHWGHNSGYRAYAIAYPARDFALVYLSNSDDGMLILRDLVRTATGEDDHPAVSHLDYESYDTPRRVVPRKLESIVLEEGVEEGIAAYFAMKDEYPEDAFEEAMLARVATRLWSTHGREDDALEVYRLNADVHAHSATAQVRLADALFAAGDLDEALSTFELALQLQPGNQRAEERVKALRLMK